MAGDCRGHRLAEAATLSPVVGVALGLIAAVCWGSADFCVAVITRRIGTLRTVLIMQVASVLAFLAVVWVVRPAADLRASDWIGLSVVAVLVVGNYLAFYKSLELGPVAIVTPVVAAYAAVVVLLALVVLGERLDVGQGIGAVMAIAGVVLASADFRNLGPESNRLSPGVKLAILSLIGFGLTSFASGVYSQRFGWLVPAVVTRVITACIFLAISGGRGEIRTKNVTAGLVAITAVVGIIEASGFLAFTRGAELGFVAVVAAASASYPLIPLAFGLTVFKERLAPNQWLGVVSVLAGVFLLAVG